MSLPEPTATFTRSWATYPRPTPDETNLYRSSVVYQAVDASRMAGASPVTAPEVTETATRITVTFGTFRTVKLTDEQVRETSALRDAWTLAEPAA